MIDLTDIDTLENSIQSINDTKLMIKPMNWLKILLRLKRILKITLMSMLAGILIFQITN